MPPLLRLVNWFAAQASGEAMDSAWQHVRVRDWTAADWELFLRSLSPRALIYQIRMWCLLAETAPDLQVQFEEACEQARHILHTTECAS